MKRNPRDIHGDGHGFRAVSQGGPPAGRKKEVRMLRNAFTRDLRKLPTNTKPFLGLYEDGVGQKFVMIIWRADTPTAGLNYLTLHGSQHPHYVADPIGWADLPHYSVDNGVVP